MPVGHLAIYPSARLVLGQSDRANFDKGVRARDAARLRRSNAVGQTSSTTLRSGAGENHAGTADALFFLATLNNGPQRYCNAESLYKRVLTIDDKVLDPQRVEVAVNPGNLARIYERQDPYADAGEPLLRTRRACPSG